MKLTMRKYDTIDDWYIIERAEHDGREWMEETGPNSFALRRSSRITEADVEGHSYEMKAIAKAIRARRYETFKRCGVDARTSPVRFWSPRNSGYTRGECSVEEADALAAMIEATLAWD